MNYNIKGTELSITAEIRDYLEKRLATIEKFLSEAARVDIELEFLKAEAGRFRAEFMIHDPKLPKMLRAEHVGSTLHESIDLSLGELTNELQRAKKKKLHVFRHSAVKVKEYLRGWRRKV